MGVPTTAEELTEVLRLFRDRDMNQNGNRNDEIPLSFVSMWDLRFLAHAFGINADDYYLTEQNGKISEVLTMEENRAFLTWLHELYTEGLLDSQGLYGHAAGGGGNVLVIVLKQQCYSEIRRVLRCNAAGRGRRESRVGVYRA